MEKNNSVKDNTCDTSSGVRRVRSLRRLQPILPILVLVSVLALNAINAQFDGTGKASVSDEFYRSTVAYEFAPTEKNIGSLDDLGDTLPLFSMQVSEDSKVMVEYAGCSVEGKLFEDWTKKGSAFYYTMSTSNQRDSVQNPDGSSSLCYVRIIQPILMKEEGTTKKWAWVLHDLLEDAVRSNWFTLRPDGSAVIGRGELDYEQATKEQISQAEVQATWRTIDETDPHAFVVEGDGISYLISFSDS